MNTLLHLITKLEPVLYVLVALGAINYGLVVLFDWNLFTEVFSSSGSVLDVVYVLIAIGGLLVLDKAFGMSDSD